MSSSKIPSISFSDLIGDNQEELSMERVESLLTKMTQAISHQSMTNPNQLVRVVHNDKVIWMSQQQAAQYLEIEDSEDDIQQSIQKALSSDLSIIRQELEVLIALARYTLNRFTELEAISKEEVNRFEPAIQRRQSELNQAVSSTIESEAVLSEKRRRNPLLGEYEEWMGEFLNAKSNGDKEYALRLAQQLKDKKKQYLLQSRAIEPDVRTIHYHRLNLQKTKKRILKTQNELCESRMEFLQIEIEDLRNSIGEVQDESHSAEVSGLDEASEEINKLRTYDLDEVQNQIDTKINELNALDQETDVLDKQERKVDAVIDHIQQNILEETEQKFDSEKIKAKPKSIQPSTPAQDTPQKKSKRSGMHFQR